MKKVSNKLSALSALLALPLAASAQEQAADNVAFSNPLFYTLLVIIIFLLIINLSLAQVLKNIAQSEDLIMKFFKRKDGESNGGPKALGLVLGFSLLGYVANAQTPIHKDDWAIGGLTPGTFYFMMGVIFLEVIAMVVLFYCIQMLLRSDAAKASVMVKENAIIQKLTGAVAIEKENEIMLGHEYDGIRELDNDLPPWWKYGFYLTIIVAVVYMIHYHVAKTGDLQLAEYNNEVEKGKQEVAEFMKNSAGNVDETNVKMLGASDIESGKQVFIANCAACHGKLGEGVVGPNLTDNYWLHGGSLSEIFKTIKYGWPDKGMKSWKEDFSPIQIAQLVSFIKSIKGSNPANAKAAQGDLFKDGGEATVVDSLAVKPDSLVTNK